MIYTIGTGHHSLEAFVDLLEDHAVTSLADVRSYPRSHLSHFSRDHLETALGRRGFTYHWLGSDLGGLRREGYRAYMGTARFVRGLDRLEALADTAVTAVCCAEMDPDRCHRHHIADALAERGWTVVHILGPGLIREHIVLAGQRELPLE